MINIFIVNYNSANQLFLSLSCFKNSIDYSVKYEQIHIFILNNSYEESENEILDKLLLEFKVYFYIHIIHSKQNLGYAGGHNYLLTKFKQYLSKDSLLFIINPDVTFKYINIISIKEIFERNYSIGQVMSKTVNENGTILYSHIILNGFFFDMSVRKQPKLNSLILIIVRVLFSQ